MTEATGASSTPKRPVVVPAIGLVLLTVLGITALLGGMNEVPDPAPPQLAKGAILDQGQYATQFVDAVITTQKAENEFGEDKRFLDLIFKVTNQGTETSPVGMPPQKPESAFTGTTFASSLVKITPTIKQEFGPMAFALAKGVDSRQLHPGVPTVVTVRFRLGDTDQPPDKVVLDVAGFEYEPGFNDTNYSWKIVSEETQEDTFLPEIKAQVTLPVTVQEPV
ncbi:hypothetical protein [Nonomuraea typhae]|uniref:DUF4352 domain-containing protein n=1 Tax=Nonomuraea typhae TaxID=2603600 RepID=A0ABW7Z2D1_9ACTN